jgi:hypothetical protein
VAALAIRQRECHAGMAGAAGLSLGDVCHRVVRHSPFHARENVGVAEFTAVPHCVFLVGEDNVRHSFHVRIELKILLDGEGIGLGGNAIDEGGRFEQPQLLGLLPIDAISEARSWKRFTEGEEVIFAGDLLAQRMASFTALGFGCLDRLELANLAPVVFDHRIYRIKLRTGTRLKDDFPLCLHLSVVASATVVPAGIVGGSDTGAARLHGKTDVHMADPAAEFCPMNPVLEDDRHGIRLLRVVVDNHAAIFVREWPSLLGSYLSNGWTAENRNQRQSKEGFSVHREPHSP